MIDAARHALEGHREQWARLLLDAPGIASTVPHVANAPDAPDVPAAPKPARKSAGSA
jgi:hypothetical protein